MHFNHIVGAVILSSVLAATAAAQNPEPLGAPPQFFLMGKVDREAGQVEVLTTFYKTVAETVTKKYVDKGVTKERAVTVERQVRETAMQPIRLDDVRIVTAGKQRLDKAAALERLKPGMIILRHTSGTKIDSRYLSVLSPDAIIFVERPGIPPAQLIPAAPAAPLHLPTPADAP